jgi:hypothetical protein
LVLVELLELVLITVELLSEELVEILVSPDHHYHWLQQRVAEEVLLLR